MANSIIWGDYLVTRADKESSQIIPNGAIYQSDGVIVDVASYSDFRAAHNTSEVIGGTGFLVMPGLVNSHHHGRGVSQFQLGGHDAPLEYWIVEGWARRGVDPYLNTLYASMKMIRSGVTTVMYNHFGADVTLPRC